ncbi:MAG TPA: FadR/GntR family transcriptional regulator [Trueperaceae bacterium]
MPTRVSDRALTYEAIVEEIKGQILEGELKPGDRLPTIAERARELNVGQGSVREAYRVLESRGVLEVVQGSGTFVSTNLGPDNEMLLSLSFTPAPTRAHLLEARRLLEPQVAALAAQRATNAERQAIVRASKEEDAALRDPGEWARHNIAFHSLICNASHNPVVSEMVLTLYEFFGKTEPHPAEDPIVREKGKHFHRLIAFSIYEGDAEAARDLMRQHIGSVETIVRRSKSSQELNGVGEEED